MSELDRQALVLLGCLVVSSAAVTFTLWLANDLRRQLQ